VSTNHGTRAEVVRQLFVDDLEPVRVAKSLVSCCTNAVLLILYQLTNKSYGIILTNFIRHPYTNMFIGRSKPLVKRSQFLFTENYACSDL
jgi:hypothetical protein